MFAQILALTLLCQTPPVAPIEPTAVVEQQFFQTQLLNKKIEALQAQVDKLSAAPCAHCGKTQAEPVLVQKKKYAMLAKDGKIYENDNYDRLLYDINLIARFGTLDIQLNQQMEPSPVIQLDQMRTVAPIIQQGSTGNCVGGSCALPQRGMSLFSGGGG